MDAIMGIVKPMCLGLSIGLLIAVLLETMMNWSRARRKRKRLREKTQLIDELAETVADSLWKEAQWSLIPEDVEEELKKRGCDPLVAIIKSKGILKQLREIW